MLEALIKWRWWAAIPVDRINQQKRFWRRIKNRYIIYSLLKILKSFVGKSVVLLFVFFGLVWGIVNVFSLITIRCQLTESSRSLEIDMRSWGINLSLRRIVARIIYMSRGLEGERWEKNEDQEHRTVLVASQFYSVSDSRKTGFETWCKVK